MRGRLIPVAAPVAAPVSALVVASVAASVAALVVVAAWWTGLPAGPTPAAAPGSEAAVPGPQAAASGLSAAVPGSPRPGRKPKAPKPCVADPAAVVARQPTSESTENELPPDLASTLDTLMRQLVDPAVPPGAIAGVSTPEGTWTQAYGVADPATGEPMNTGMHMRIGSVTKSFTGTVILQLAQEGKLSLTDPIGKYDKEIPNGDKITLKHLTDMTSGIAGYYTDAFLDRYFADPTRTFTPDQLIAYGVAASPIFEPGEMFNNSGTNMILLGKVIEAVTGQPMRTVLQQRILDPLELAGTSLPDVSPEIPSPHPQGFTMHGSKTAGEPVNATNWNPSFGWTAGGMISNLSDMLAYTRALGTGQGLLPSADQIRRLESFQASSGYGLALHCVDGWVGHSGRLPGFNTAAYYDTTTDTSVVVMVNSDIASGDCQVTQALTDNPAQAPCASPAMRVFMGLAEALGHKFEPSS